MPTAEALEWDHYIAARKAWAELDPVRIESIIVTPEALQTFSKEEFLTRISQYGAQTVEAVQTRFTTLEVALSYADKAFAESAKQKRDTGEDRTYHALRMAYLLASNGITDVTVLQATILHDVPEDTGITLAEISQYFGAEVATLVDLVTKVKMRKINGTKPKTDSPEAKDTPTLEKFFDALNDDVRAMYIKIADVADNSETYDVYDKKKAKYKAGLALKYYEPLARDLGLHGLAQIIGDNAFKIVNPRVYKEILSLREEFRVEEMLVSLQKLLSSWMEDVDLTLRTELDFESATIRLPGIYESYREAPKREIKKEHVLPRVDIVCHQWVEAMIWDAFLRNHQFTTDDSSGRIDRLLISGQSIGESVRIPLLGEDETIVFTLSTTNGEMMPVYIDMGAQSLTDEQRNAAALRLQRLRDYYKEVTEGKNKIDGMAERLGKEVKLAVRAPDNAVYEFTEDGITVLDFAYRMGRDLGTNAFGANALRDGKEMSLQLSDRLQNNDTVFVLADKKGADISRVRPERLDWVVTEKARVDVSAELERITRDPKTSEELQEEIRKAAHRRGVDIIKWLYESEKGAQLDFLVEYGFESDQHLMDVYGDKDNLLQQLGFIPLARPLDKTSQQETLERWNDAAWAFKRAKELRVTASTRDLAYDALCLTSNLVKFRERRPSLHIQLHHDAKGLLQRISAVVEKHGINILPISGKADLYSHGDASELDICLIEGDVQGEAIRNLQQELVEMLGSGGSVEIISLEKN